MTTAPQQPPATGEGRPPVRPADEVLARLAEIDTTQEELHVVEEALRAEQDQVRQLILRHDTEHRWRTHLSALVPIGLGVTDGHGKLIEANPALAAHLGVGLHRLPGKPLSVYLSSGDVRAFRTMLSALADGTAAEHRVLVTVRSRGQADARGELFGFAERADPDPHSARVQWVLVPTGGALETVGPADEQDTRSAVESDALAAALSQLSALPVDEADEQRLLSRMAALVRSAVPTADWVSITLGSPRDPRRIGSESTEAQQFDGWQLQAGEGPCVDAQSTGTVLTSGDVADDERWPQLSKLAADGGVRSVLSLPVRESGEATGVINVYSRRRYAFGPANRRVAELVAAAVTGVLQTVAERHSLQELASNLEQALTSRAVIDQAKGVLMAHLQVSADEAFARLVALSSRLNVKVRDLARLVVEGDAQSVVNALGRDTLDR